MKMEDSNNWSDDEMWENAIQQAECLDDEEKKDFVLGDLYEDKRI